MYDSSKAKAFYYKKIEEDLNFNKNLIEKFMEAMPEHFSKIMYEEEHGYHINDLDLYDEAVSYFKNPDGTAGSHWSLDEIEESTSIDFSNAKYTLYDFAYVVNMIYSDYGEIVKKYVDDSDVVKVHLCMAKEYLTDCDYYGDSSERAYRDAIKRINYFEN